MGRGWGCAGLLNAAYVSKGVEHSTLLRLRTPRSQPLHLARRSDNEVTLASCASDGKAIQGQEALYYGQSEHISISHSHVGSRCRSPKRKREESFILPPSPLWWARQHRITPHCHALNWQGMVVMCDVSYFMSSAL